MKKISIIARLNIGGPAVHIANLCCLDRYGYETVLIHGSIAQGEGDMSYVLQDKKVTVIHVPELGREISLFNDLKVFWKIYTIIRKEKPAIVHTHTAKAGMVGRIAARCAGVKQIYHTFHGHVFHGYFGKLKTQFFIGIEWVLAKISTRIIVLSEQQRLEIGHIVGIPKKKMVIIPLGFDLSRLGVRNSSWFEKQGLPKERIKIAIVGRITSIKNHILFIDVLTQLKKQGVNLIAFIVGDGDLRSQIESFASEKGLVGQVIFTGWMQELAPLYNGLDYLFLTSRNEGTPVAVIEAMAAGVIVISTAVGGVPDIITDGESGFLVAEQSAEAFAKRFAEVDAMSEVEKAGVRERAKKAVERFSIEALLENVDGLYRGKGGR